MQQWSGQPLLTKANPTESDGITLQLNQGQARLEAALAQLPHHTYHAAQWTHSPPSRHPARSLHWRPALLPMVLQGQVPPAAKGPVEDSPPTGHSVSSSHPLHRNHGHGQLVLGPAR
jgi:hypothetical protein